MLGPALPSVKAGTKLLGRCVRSHTTGKDGRAAARGNQRAANRGLAQTDVTGNGSDRFAAGATELDDFSLVCVAGTTDSVVSAVPSPP